MVLYHLGFNLYMKWNVSDSLLKSGPVSDAFRLHTLFYKYVIKNYNYCDDLEKLVLIY